MMIIAIDGHSACGKSTLAKDIARSLHFVYIDSGAMYRAVTYYLLKHKIDLKQLSEVETCLNQINLQFIPGDQPKILLNNVNVSELIRSLDVSQWVSQVAAISIVRKKLVHLQHEISKDKSVVMDGRDIGSVVFPHADVKFFLTADIDTRTARRYQELISRGIETNFDEVKENLKTRDYIDSTRTDSPLIQASDAYVLDNSKLTREEQTKLALDIIQKVKSHS